MTTLRDFFSASLLMFSTSLAVLRPDTWKGRSVAQRLRGLACAIVIGAGALMPVGATPPDWAAQVDATYLTESYAQGRDIATAALADPAHREQALDALFNLLLESPRDVTEAEWTAWVDALTTARRERDGDQARSLATVAAWRAEVAWRARNMEAANAALADARASLQDGQGEISPAERAYVLATAAQLTAMQGGFDDAAVLATQAIDAVRVPHTGLEQVRRLRAYYFSAMAQDRQGHIDAAAATAREGLKLAEAIGIPQNGYRRRMLGILSESLISQGEFTTVRDLMRPELERLRGLANPSNRDLAYTLGHLAEAERQLGNPDIALQLYRESAAAAEKDEALVASGSYAAILGNLGTLAFETGHYDEANVALAQNLGMLEKQFGPNSVRVVPPLTDSGEVALRRGLLDEAEALFRRALAIVATELGPEHPEGAPALRGLARVKLQRGDAVAAQQMLEGALAQRQSSVGPRHPQLLEWRCELAEAQARKGDTAAAFQTALAVEQQRTALVASVAPALGETQSLDFKRALSRCSGRMLAAAREGDAERVITAWSAIAAARGLATHIGAARLAAARQAAAPADREKWEKWTKAASAYALALRTGAPPEQLSALRVEVDKAVEQLGTALAVTQRPPVQSLLGARPAGAALVAFAVGDAFDATDESVRGKAHVYAFVARDSADPVLLDLGEAAAIDAVAGRWYRTLLQPRTSDTELRDAGFALRKRVYDPLRLATANQRVFVVPDAGLHRLNLAALPDGDGFLLERGVRVHLLETEHDLALSAPATAASRNGLLLVGVSRLGKKDTESLGRLRSGCPEVANAFAPLPGAEREINALSRIARAAGYAQVTTLSGTRATATAVARELPQSDVVHFATHAFELGASCAPQLIAGRRGVGLRRGDTDPAGTARQALAREAGLLLSGESGDNGLLLGADVSTLSMDHARWVVLSACDTGLGQRFSDEGVFGLRRAFRLAGARTVIMSLWPVDDVATAQWMEALYSARLADKQETPDAMAKASLTVIAQRREQGESTHPFYWAGFVASGDWR
ncbi:CHAT domain-containing protein [Tahibacter amnicola]|uniref:CHAT domain-containing protein n=1 Tax=Tahibacter amnicola TaxID=2976241 RepID=A0ABY6BA91_9GAMM|nr:CHAT domain-containing protein [Tahibacter amnicola]UXI66779.1 CHAT domain-containing protein [Tahibacter amnicola]